jgi:hypothetical protein
VTVDLTATAGTAFSLADPLKVYSAAIVGWLGFARGGGLSARGLATGTFDLWVAARDLAASTAVTTTPVSSTPGSRWNQGIA